MAARCDAAARAIEEQRRAPARALAGRGGLGHPRHRHHQHGAGHARRVDRARARPARSRPSWRSEDRVPSTAAGSPRRPRHTARDPAGGGRRHRGHRTAGRGGAIRRRAHATSRRIDSLDSARVDAMYAEMAAQAMEVVRESAAPAGPGCRPLGGRALRRPGLRADRAGARRHARRRRRSPRAHRVRRALRRALWLRQPRRAGGGRDVEAVGHRRTRRACARQGRAVAGDAGRARGVRRAYFPEDARIRRVPGLRPLRRCRRARPHGPAIVEERESTTVLPPGVARDRRRVCEPGRQRCARDRGRVDPTSSAR